MHVELQYISNELSASDIIKLFGRPIMQDLIAKEYGFAVSDIKDLILEKYQALDELISAGKTLRNVMQKFSFSLEDLWFFWFRVSFNEY